MDRPVFKRSINLKELRSILFDFDGTLLDSFPTHFQAYQATFARFEISLTEDEFRRTYSPNWYQTYQALGLPREVWDLADSYWLEEAAKQEPGLLPGVKAMLPQLQHRYVLGLVTSGSRNRVLRDLSRTDLAGFFQAVVTGDDVQEPKPAPVGLNVALAKLGLQPNEAVYIGDTPADYEMARAAGVDFIGVASQFSLSRPDDEYVQLNSIGELGELAALD
jgi:pyrophosphatase PpaX